MKWMALALALLAAGCTKTGFGDVGEGGDSPLPGGGSGGSGGRNTAGNSRAYIEKITRGGETVCFAWNNDKLQSITKEVDGDPGYPKIYEFSYIDTLVRKVVVKDPSGNESMRVELFYSDDHVQSITTTTSGTDAETVHFTYDEYGLMATALNKELVTWNGDSLTHVNFGAAITWNGDNLTHVNYIEFYPDQYDYIHSIERSVDYEYDSKLSVFDGMNQSVRMAYLACFSNINYYGNYYDDFSSISSTLESFAKALSRNNPTSIYSGMQYIGDRPVSAMSSWGEPLYFKYTDGVGLDGDE